jgi:IS4 transposase
VWYEADSQAHDQRFWARILRALGAGTLLLFDLGFLNHALFDRLTDAGVGLLTRLKANATYRVERVLTWGPDTYDQLVWLGRGEARCRHLMRVVGVRHGGTWHRYRTNVLDPARLPAADVAARYACRWGCEDAFHAVKRLLGLAYFYVGAPNAVQTQLWATWLLYAVLVDLTDAVAAAVHRPADSVSLEMVYRGL